MEEGALITERILATFMERYFGKGHNLYIDNFYTSLRLANYLIENCTNITGTIRENRKQFPLEVKSTILQKRDRQHSINMTALQLQSIEQKGIVLEGNLKWYMF